MIKIAITGNIGTGKSTVSKIIKLLGYKVFDSDNEIKKLLKKEIVINVIAKKFDDVPTLLNKDGFVDTTKLGNHVFSNKKELKKLENILHPMIWKNQKKFIKRNENEKVLFFDIPLLFEKQLHKNYNFIIYTTVDYEIQKRRVLERKQMDHGKFEKIIKNQKKMNKALKKFVSLELDTNQEIKKIKSIVKLFMKNIGA